MQRRRVLLVFGLSAMALGAASCKTKAGYGGGGGGGGGGASWLVGQGGLMLRVNHDDLLHPSRYNLPVRHDLYAIACRGEREAWVAGAAGTILRTADGGATWQVVPNEGTAALRAVAVAAEGGVYVAGDGDLRYSADAGQHWRVVDAQGASFTSVATTAAGDVALLTSADGGIWRYEAGPDRLTRAAESGGVPLRSVAITADGRKAVVAGDQGMFLHSEDGGRSFARRDLGTTRGLQRVWLVQTGDRAVAVGEAGVIVDLTGDLPPRIEERLGAAGALHSLHLSADGNGLTVGDNGAALVTSDGGLTWDPLALGTTATVYGVDALHSEPHL